MVEQATHNRLVTGSNPVGATNLSDSASVLGLWLATADNGP